MSGPDCDTCGEYFLDCRCKKIQNSLTVKELTDLLSRYPSNMNVLITWEGILREINEDNIYESKVNFLIIDADCNSYKEYFQKSKD